MIAAGKKVFAAAPEMTRIFFYVIWNFSFRNGWSHSLDMEDYEAINSLKRY
jgi:hypothetical protein